MPQYDENHLQELFDAAQAHGDCEGSESEIGDLQGALSAAFELLSQEQLVKFFADHHVAGVLAGGEVVVVPEDRPFPGEGFDGV